MFDQIVGEKTARKPFAVAVSFCGQAFVLGLAILVPLLHTKAITAGKLTHIVPLRPWGPDPIQQRPAVRAASKPGVRVFNDHVFRQPATIPIHIAFVEDAPTVESVPGSSAFSGTPDGVFAVIPTAVIPPKPPAPEPVPQKTEAAAPPRVKVGGVVQAAKILRQATPVYPVLAKQARISGVVRLEAVISREGTVESLRVISGHPLLVPAAVEAVRQWLYRPTVLNGDPVEVLTQIDVHFKLGE